MSKAKLIITAPRRGTSRRAARAAENGDQSGSNVEQDQVVTGTVGSRPKLLSTRSDGNDR